MPRRYRELWYALIAIVAITALYLVAYQRAGSFPAAYSLVGHGIGILGFILMLMTETLYSIRKQLTDARWGSMAGWLRFHMVTGLVGPYMVLLHTAVRFRGLAGVVMLLTIIVVVSGLVGRYIYTAVPRAIDGTEVEVSAVDRRIARAEVSSMGSGGLETASAVALAPSSLGDHHAEEMQTLVSRQRSLDRRLHRLAAERGTLAAWRSFHVPLTWVLFVTALVHIVAAVYYATLLR